MTFEDCLAKGLIRKAENTRDRIESSLKLGDKFLKSSKKNLEIEENEVSEMIAYTALFHYARALLFNKGYIERSHACLFIALKKLYPKQAELFEKADKIRTERHNLQYSGFFTNAEAAEYVIEFVAEFGSEAKKILKSV